MKSMKIFLGLWFVSAGFSAFAQEPPKEKDPQELAIEEAARMERELALRPDQAFYIDSILQHNYVALKEEFDTMSSSGMQDGRNYQTVREKWINKNLEAFKKVLDEQQYIRYLRTIGRGKEYKKGKDGLYYKKEPKPGKEKRG